MGANPPLLYVLKIYYTGHAYTVTLCHGFEQLSSLLFFLMTFHDLLQSFIKNLPVTSYIYCNSVSQDNSHAQNHDTVKVTNDSTSGSPNEVFFTKKGPIPLLLRLTINS